VPIQAQLPVQAEVPVQADGELPRRVRGASGAQASPGVANPYTDLTSTAAKVLRARPVRFAASADPAAPSIWRPGPRPGTPILARLSAPDYPAAPEETAGAQQTAVAEPTAAAEQPLATGRQAVSAPTGPPPTGPPPTGPPPTGPPPTGPPPTALSLVASSRRRPAPSARRWRLAGLVVAVVVLAAVAALILIVDSPGTATRAGGRPPANLVTVEAAVRSQAVAWVTSQVSQDTVIACDAPTCSDLAQHGFPAGNLNTLPSTAPDPYGSQLIIATAAIRSQFGSKLADVFAPEVLASFGTGVSRIDIRLIAPDGTAAFSAALRADQQARKFSGTQLLANKRITTTSTARTALASGEVDDRLLTTLAFLASQEPIDIVGFGSPAPGSSPGVPLRTVDLAQTDPASRIGGPAYLRQLVAVLHRQVPPYRPMTITVMQLADGQSVLQILFGAPSPFGLLHS
jgi:hypothetical protein